MAKRRKEKDEEEDKGFKIPKFDKEEFLKKERRNIKSMFIAFLFAVVMAVICFGFFALMGPETEMRWFLVLLVAIFSASFIKYFYMRLNLDTSEFTKKNWFTTYAVYFVAWLLILTILVNPPFHDDVNPRINMVLVPNAQEFGGDVEIAAKITDNADITKDGIVLKLNDEVISNDEYTFENDLLHYTFESPSSYIGEKSYTVEISATDINQLSSTVSRSFTYSNDTIRLTSHEKAYTEPVEIVGDTPLTFRVETDVNRVYYTIDNGTSINMSYDSDQDYWYTSAKYKGWPKDKNVTVRVFAEKIYYFPVVTQIQNPEGSEKIMKELREIADEFNNTIIDNQNYYFKVQSLEVGMIDPPNVKEPNPELVKVPGFETIIFLLALVAVILIVRYKKKDKK